MKSITLKLLINIYLLTLFSMYTMAADYHFSEQYISSSETKLLRAKWNGEAFLGCTIVPPPWVGWPSSKFIRLTLKKSGIEEGFGQRTFFSNFSTGENIISSAALPLVVGQSYELSVDYYGSIPSGSSCTGSDMIRNVDTKTFVYDVHDTVLTFGIDMNVHSRKLHHSQTNKCLIPNDLSSAFDSRVGATACTSNPNLAFEIMDAGTGIDGEVKIKSQLLRQCISPRPTSATYNGAAVRAGSCLDNDRTIFVIDRIKNPNTGEFDPHKIRLRHKASGTCLYNYDYDDTAHVWSCWNDSNFIFTLDEF